MSDGEAAQDHVGRAGQSLRDALIARQRPPSQRELDAESRERRRRRSLAARAAAEAGGMASLVAALLSSGCQFTIDGAA